MTANLVKQAAPGNVSARVRSAGTLGENRKLLTANR
jgi:hypothetical protein